MTLLGPKNVRIDLTPAVSVDHIHSVVVGLYECIKIEIPGTEPSFTGTVIVDAERVRRLVKQAIEAETIQLQAKLKKAVDGLKHYADVHNWDDEYIGSFARYKAGKFGMDVARETLKEIGEV